MTFKLSQKYIDFIKDMDSKADFLEGTELQQAARLQSVPV